MELALPLVYFPLTVLVFYSIVYIILDNLHFTWLFFLMFPIIPLQSTTSICPYVFSSSSLFIQQTPLLSDEIMTSGSLHHTSQQRLFQHYLSQSFRSYVMFWRTLSLQELRSLLNDRCSLDCQVYFFLLGRVFHYMHPPSFKFKRKTYTRSVKLRLWQAFYKLRWLL